MAGRCAVILTRVKQSRTDAASRLGSLISERVPIAFPLDILRTLDAYGFLKCDGLDHSGET
jgi:hypothetical protein